MKSLKVALVIKDTKPRHRAREMRNIGLFSYAVPEFEWTHARVGKGNRNDRGHFRDYDVIVTQDGAWGQWDGRGPPVVGIFWDSTWTEGHYKLRYKQAQQCDLVLIGHDRLERFKSAQKRTRRLLYCVNDHVFKDYGLERTVDVGYHCNTKLSDKRVELRRFLARWCKRRGYSCACKPVRGLVDYAQSFNRARISVNMPRVPANRPHRVFDVMASRSCLMTGQLPDVSGCHIELGTHYVQFNDNEGMTRAIDELLETGRWQEIADAGHALIQEHYTWSARAKELRELLNKELGL